MHFLISTRMASSEDSLLLTKNSLLTKKIRKKQKPKVLSIPREERRLRDSQMNNWIEQLLISMIGWLKTGNLN